MKKLFVVSLALFFSLQVNAKEDTQKLEPIVITAHRVHNQLDLVERFATKMQVDYNFDKEKVKQLILDVQPNDEVLAHFKKKKKRKGDDESPEEIAFRFERRISNGVKFWYEHKDAVARAEKEYGVSQETIVALLGIETNYGTYTGTYNTFDTLVTLGFYGNHRADYFRNELESWLVLSRDLDWDIKEVKGSYAGAIGIPQFMPSAVKPFAVDWTGTEKYDILHNADNGIASAANFLIQHGWDKNAPIAVQVSAKQGKKTFVSHVLPGPKPTIWLKKPNYYNVLHYNPSDEYVMSIFILSQKIKDRYSEYSAQMQSTEELKLPDTQVDRPASAN